jgi:hypothetical protein
MFKIQKPDTRPYSFPPPPKPPTGGRFATAGGEAPRQKKQILDAFPEENKLESDYTESDQIKQLQKRANPQESLLAEVQPEEEVLNTASSSSREVVGDLRGGGSELNASEPEIASGFHQWVNSFQVEITDLNSETALKADFIESAESDFGIPMELFALGLFCVGVAGLVFYLQKQKK